MAQKLNVVRHRKRPKTRRLVKADSIRRWEAVVFIERSWQYSSLPLNRLVHANTDLNTASRKRSSLSIIRLEFERTRACFQQLLCANATIVWLKNVLISSVGARIKSIRDFDMFVEYICPCRCSCEKRWKHENELEEREVIVTATLLA